MNIGGLQKFSLLDYPGYLSAIVFTQGCNFRCPFCYNPMLVMHSADEVQDKATFEKDAPKKSYSQGLPSGKLVQEDDFFVFLETRRGKLDAVVITGGEPTLQRDLIKFIKKVGKAGFKIKLDTNGTNPAMIKELLDKGLVDYIAMDIKTAQDKYKNVTGVDLGFKNIRKSTIIIKGGSIPYEFRTTIVPGMHKPEDIENIGKLINGAEKWYLQVFKSDTDLIDNSLKKTGPIPNDIIKRMQKIIKKYANFSDVR